MLKERYDEFKELLKASNNHIIHQYGYGFLNLYEIKSVENTKDYHCFAKTLDGEKLFICDYSMKGNVLYVSVSENY